MELIFKKYQSLELHTERTYLIYDPSYNQKQFTNQLWKSISHRNFTQGCEKILIGPILENHKMTVRVLTPDGMEAALEPSIQNIFTAYLKDQGYPISQPPAGNIHEYGTVYYFPA